MKFCTILSSLALGVSTTLALTTTLSYDAFYDNASTSLTTVACSDGPNGLIPRGYSTFGSLPGWPNVAAAPSVTGWNSPSCGTCWEVTYTNAQGGKKSLNVIAIDVGSAGFVLGKNTMDTLTNGQAAQLGRVNVEYTQVAPTACGFKA